MDCQRPIFNEYTRKWEVWDFAYMEGEERMYVLHEFFDYDEAIDLWKLRNPKPNSEIIQKYININNSNSNRKNK